MSKKGKMLSSIKFRTPVFRVSFPALFEPKSFEDGPPVYSVTTLFDADADLSVFEKAVKGVIQDKLNGKRPKKLKVTEIQDGDDIEKKNGDPREECQGKRVIQLRSKRKPVIVDNYREPITDPEEVYGGCYATAIVQAFYWDNKFGSGVSFDLVALQKIKNGEPFVGSQFAKDDFEEYEDDEDYEDVL